MSAKRVPRPFRHLLTIRARTTLVASLAVALTLVVASVAVVLILRRTLVQNIDEVADLRAEDVVALARQGLLPHTLANLEDEDAAVQVVDDNDTVLAATANLAGEGRLTTFVPGRHSTARTLRGVPGIGSHEARVTAMRSRADGSFVTVYVATSLEPVDETLSIVRGLLLVGGPIVFIAVSLVCWLVVGRTLRPVAAIRQEAADITTADLSRRVPEPPNVDEIGMLARTINEMLERIERGAKQQRRFVSDASHELRSPLAATRTDLEVALAHPDQSDWPTTATGVLEDNRRMERLVEDLLFLARVDEGYLPQPGVLVDFNDVVLSEVTRLRPYGGPSIDATNVSGAAVVGHREDLRRLVRNLVENAQRHAAKTVSLRLGTGDGTVMLDVADDGPGIPAAARKEIFERFARLDEARDAESGGSGLGLSIAREIAEQHGGSIDVGTAPDGGALFTVRLPSAR